MLTRAPRTLLMLRPGFSRARALSLAADDQEGADQAPAKAADTGGGKFSGPSAEDIFNHLEGKSNRDAEQLENKRLKDATEEQSGVLKGSAQKDEIGGPAGVEPTRYGDWERAGRTTDF